MGRSQHTFSLSRLSAWPLALAVFAVFALQAILPASAAALATLQGKLVATDSGEAIGFADLLLIPADTTMQKVGALSNADGTFLLKAAAGRYTLQIRALSYARKRIENLELAEGQLLPFSTTLEPEAIQQKEIVVEATAKQNTEASVLATRRKATTVGDAVSAEQIRRAPDKNASDVLRRVTGLSVSEGKYVFVRGMGERYNSTEVDGVRIASPEQGKRVVPMDLFPSALIDNIVVQKTWSADRSGEFSGGDVQLHLKDFPGKRAWSFSVSQSMTDGTTFKNRLSYASSNRDVLGFGTSSRKLPDGAIPVSLALSTYSASVFGNIWSPKSMKTIPNGSYALTYGDELKPFGKSIGVIQAITLSRSFDQRDEVERFANGTDPSDVTSTYSGQRSNESVQLGANTKLSLRPSPSQVLSLRAIYLNKADDEVRAYEGRDPKEFEQVAWRVNRSSYVQRTLRSLALEGKHDMAGLAHSSLNWTFSRNDARRQSPDKRESRYRMNLESTEPIYILTPGIREYGDLRENGWGTNAKITTPFRFSTRGSGRFLAGFDRQSRRRDNRYRMFRFTPAEPSDAPPESLYRDSQSHPKSVEAFLGLDNDNYFADQLVEATFINAEIPISKRLRGSVGLRREFGSQTIVSRGLLLNREVREGSYQSTDWLTGLNLTYAWTEKFNIRGASSRTLNRPDMDDLSPQQFQEQPNASLTTGNPALRRSLITNYDLRFELFPNIGEVFAAGFFFKDFSNPIELANFPGDITKPTNSDGGHNVGVELEARTSLSHLLRALKPFSLNSNLSLVRSEITLVQTTDLGNKQHSLVGQAPYMLNLGVTWASASGRSELTVLTSSVGRRLKELKITDGVGFAQKRSNREFGALTTLDAAATLTPFKGTRLRFAAGNLLDSVVRELDGTVESRRYTTGRTFSVSLSVGQ